jgi:carboxypeptidase Q
VSNRTSGGSDHIFFSDAGLPGFPFIQDPLAYRTRTHHSNMDVFDYLIEDDLKQSAMIVAAVAYQASTHAGPFPPSATDSEGLRRD